MVMLKRSHNIGKFLIFYSMGFPGGSDGKESACNARDPGFIPGSERSPGEGKGYSLQYCGLENSMDCIVHEVTKMFYICLNIYGLS